MPQEDYSPSFSDWGGSTTIVKHFPTGTFAIAFLGVLIWLASIYGAWVIIKKRKSSISYIKIPPEKGVAIRNLLTFFVIIPILLALINFAYLYIDYALKDAFDYMLNISRRAEEWGNWGIGILSFIFLGIAHILSLIILPKDLITKHFIIKIKYFLVFYSIASGIIHLILVYL